MTKKWLITGGCGFLGSNLAATLLSAGDDVVVFDALARVGAHDNLAWLQTRAAEHGRGRLTFIRADVRCQSDVDDAFARHGEGVATVAHLAGQVAMTTSIERPRYDFEVNVLGTINILEAVRRHASGAVVLFSSTNKVYGDLRQLTHACGETRWRLTERPHGLDETTPLSFHSPYGCSKGAADQYVLDYHRMFGVRGIVLRHSSMYGGRQFATFDQGWVGWFCQEVMRQKRETQAHRQPEPFTISGDGKQVRDLLVVEDAVDCYRQAAAHPEAVGHAFNIGGGPDNSLSLLELFALLEAELGQKARFVQQPERHSDQRVFIADIRKAAKLLDWRPSVGVQEGVRRILGWLTTLSTGRAQTSTGR